MIPPRSEMPKENYTLPPAEAAKVIGKQMEIRAEAAGKIDIKTIWNQAFEWFTNQKASVKPAETTPKTTEPHSPDQSSESSGDDRFEPDDDYMFRLPFGVGSGFRKAAAEAEAAKKIHNEDTTIIANAAAGRTKGQMGAHRMKG